jgi:hypothetical protein
MPIISEIKLVKATKVAALPDYRLEAVFSDGSSGVIDLTDFVMADGPVVEPLRDRGFFAKVFLVMGVPTWPNGCDVDPTRLRMDMEAAGALRPAHAAA